MQVKIAELKNNLSRFLKRLAKTGEAITILDRNRPVARLTPMRGKQGLLGSSWSKERETLLSRAAKKGVKLRLQEDEPPPLSSLKIAPSVAPDGRTDLETAVQLRKEKEY